MNLKNLSVDLGTRVDRDLIEKLVKRTLNRPNDRDIAEFLEEEFELGIGAGTWLFIFDSFDEIPEILSSTEADETINTYAQAIWDFLNGLNRCRGIVASRLFRGPRQLGWPRFQIVPLSFARQTELVRNSGLKRDIRDDLSGKLAAAGGDLQLMASNPMFLGLLCEHMRSGHGFPSNSHTVFETYVTSRLNRDALRVQQRYQVPARQLRQAAEAVAFCISADNDLGLNPRRAHCLIL